jgi:hypothetical protein
MYRNQRRLSLNPAEQVTLEQARDCHPKPYVRERAAALLRVAAGQSAHQVARGGILKARKPDTVYDWLDGYEKKGLAGLYQRPRLSKRGFSP